MGRFLDWLENGSSPAPVVDERVERFNASLKSLVVSSAAQAAMQYPTKAMAVASIFRARMMNADTLGSLPVRVGESLVGAPNETQDTQEFVVETVLSMQDVGEAYWKIDGKGVYVLNPARITASWSEDWTTRLYEYDGRKMRTAGMSRNLIVIPMNRAAGDLTGSGPMQSNRIAGLIAEQKYSQDYFENNAQHTGALTHPGILTAEEAKKLYDQWTLGQENRTTGILSGGMDYKPLSFNPQDSEWVNTHLVGVGDVATLFGVPSALLNYNQPGSSITYQAIGDVYEGYWRQTLAPTYARRIERAWTQVLGTQVRFDPEELFLASLRERGEVAVQLVAAGYDPAGSLDITGLPPIGYIGAPDAANIQSATPTGI
jgi:HK97 family phage portal protein